jgi:4'-phosphopantetheinyl transferase
MIAWSAGPLVPVLAADEVHVWAVALTVGGERVMELSALLDEEERGRSARFTHVPSRQQFTICRATLRVLLGRYLDLPPKMVRFAFGPQGKPVLASGALHFNVSHTQGMALIAVTRLGPIGIDVEQARTYPTHRDMADRFFTPAESAALRSLPVEASEEAFFHIWTRKEAFLKALGLGLAHGLERFEVSVPPNDPARILHIDGDRTAGDRWSLSVLEPAAGYVGALAVEALKHELKCWVIGDGFG